MIEARVCRYSEYDGTFDLMEWTESFEVTKGPWHRTGKLAARPAWLVRAVTFGKVGGHTWRPALGPSQSRPKPEFVLWFVTDPRRFVREFRNSEE